jgi:hypothetical protein
MRRSNGTNSRSWEPENSNSVLARSSLPLWRICPTFGTIIAL